jgi:hypothetical protein
MLFREIIAVYCENNTEHINTLCSSQNIEYSFINVEAGGIYSYHRIVKDPEWNRKCWTLAVREVVTVIVKLAEEIGAQETSNGS